jgi:3-dehydroquinate synthetase
MAVSIGVAVEASLSTRMGVLHPRDRQRILDLLERYDLPTRIPKSCDAETLLELMRSDKKAEEGRIAVVLPRKVGDVIVAQAVPPEAIREALEEAQA